MQRRKLKKRERRRKKKRGRTLLLMKTESTFRLSRKLRLKPLSFRRCSKLEPLLLSRNFRCKLRSSPEHQLLHHLKNKTMDMKRQSKK